MFVSQLAGQDRYHRAGEDHRIPTTLERISQSLNPVLTDELIAHGAEELKVLCALREKVNVFLKVSIKS